MLRSLYNSTLVAEAAMEPSIAEADRAGFVESQPRISSREKLVRTIRRLALALLLSLVGAIALTPLPATPSELFGSGSAQTLNLLVNLSSSSVSHAQTPVSMYVPASIDRARPPRILVVLHGMNGSGQELAASFAEEAERSGWIVVAPTFQYRDWRDPDQVRLDDREKIAALQDIIQAVPIELGFPVLSQVEVFGFSRGAQLAARPGASRRGHSSRD